MEEVILFLVDNTQDAVIQQSRRQGWPLLHWCCANGHLAAVRALLKRVSGVALETLSDTRFPADLNVPGAAAHLTVPYRLTALGVAIYKNQGEIVQALLDAGAATTRVMEPACPAPAAAVKFGRLDLVRLLLAQPAGGAGGAGALAADVEGRDANGWTALTHALCQPDQTFMQCLLDAGASLQAAITNLANISVQRLFVKDIVAGNPMAVTKLIEAGADPTAPGGNGYLPLVVACRECPAPADVITVLLRTDRVAVNATHEGGRTALMELVCRSGPGIAPAVHAMLDRAGLNLGLRDTAGCSALYHALSNTDTPSEVLLRLVDMSFQDDLLAKTNNGRTMLFPACKHVDATPLRRLLDRGVDAHIRDNQGNTAFSDACYMDRRDAVRALLAVPGLDTTCPDGRHLVQVACDKDRWALAGVLAYSPSVTAMAPVPTGSSEHIFRVSSLRKAIAALLSHREPIRGIPVPRLTDASDLAGLLAVTRPVTNAALGGMLAPPVHMAMAWEQGDMEGALSAVNDLLEGSAMMKPEVRHFLVSVVLPWIEVVAPKLGLTVAREAT